MVWKEIKFSFSSANNTKLFLYSECSNEAGIMMREKIYE